MELTEILPDLKEKVNNFRKYGTAIKPGNWKQIDRAREHNLKLKAERQKWSKIQEARAYNLALRMRQQEQQDLRMLELVKVNPMALSSVR